MNRNNRTEGIYSINLNDSSVTTVIEDNNIYANPVCRSDGSMLAFASNLNNDFDERHIFLMTSGGENLRQVTSNNFFETMPSWAPDGSKLAFSSAKAN